VAADFFAATYRFLIETISRSLYVLTHLDRCPCDRSPSEGQPDETRRRSVPYSSSIAVGLLFPLLGRERPYEAHVSLALEVGSRRPTQQHDTKKATQS